MSGGGGSGGIGPSGPTENVDCAKLAFDTTLTSPQKPIVDTLAVGAVLELEVREAGGRKIIAAVTQAGDVAGSITDRTPDLLRCMQEGVMYVADVTVVNGGWIELHVHAA